MILAGVVLKENDSIIYFDSSNYQLKKDVTVVVNTEHGLQFGRVEIPSFELKKQDRKRKFDKIVRIASKKDYYSYVQNNKDSEEALIKGRELAKKYNLDMRIIDAKFMLDRDRLVFQFVADGRVDFRELARELANCYKTRIELYQIGVRDKAKEAGGCGLCGRKLCCSRFDNNFSSVSINMAKNQNLSLNPSKINGVCGRLLCCLRYEDEQYKECRKCLPQIGKTVEIAEGKGKVLNVDIINKKYTVNIPDKGNIEVMVEDGSC